jgi:LuxR family transcriptional regulator, maltose regulon positive regulatory protein
MELVSTKLEPPLNPCELVTRPRLQQRLDDASKVSLTIIQTPAGYGKTSLLSQWFAALRPAPCQIGWLSLDASDRDPVGLLCYVAAALTAGGARFDSSFDRGFATEVYTAPEPLIAAMVNCFKKTPVPVYLFLDDVHLLTPEPLAALCQLIDRSPPTVHYVMASRVISDLHLARMRARGRLLELDVDDLKFTAIETHDFIASAGDHDLDDTELSTLEERTEGWIAGIKLASLAMRGKSPAKEVLASFTGSRRSVSDFFVEEVLSAQPAEVRNFLLKTSVLDRLCPALCNFVTGENHGQQMIHLVEGSGLFLLRLDDERNWYRYHHLFAEFLHRRLVDENPNADCPLHLLASRWFWEQGSYVEAIEHALKGRDPRRAAELLELRCQDMTYTGQLRLVSSFAAQIPDEVLHQYPRLMLSIAWLLTRNLRFEETRKLLAAVDNLLLERESTKQLPPDEQRVLRHLYLHRKMMLSAAQDDAPSVEQQCLHLIQGFKEDTHPYLAGTIYAQLLYAQREQYQLTDLERLHATAQGILSRSAFHFASIALQASVGPSLYFAGRSDAAMRALEQGLAEGIRFGGRNSSLAALPALPLSDLLYERNELDRAQQLIEDTLQYATDLGFVDQLMPGFITHARIKRARGDLGGAFRALDEGMAIAAERGLERLRLAVVAERVKFLMQDGLATEATRYAHSAGIPQAADSVLPKGTSVTTRDEYRATAWFRIALSEDRVNEAISVAKHWRTFCAARGAIRSLVRWDILIAQALFVTGDARTAQRNLREAIAHAAVSSLVRSFIDEGPVIHTLIASTFETDLEVLHPTDAFAATLLEVFERTNKKACPRPAARTSSEGLYGKLSVKEREILALVSSGMRNREVAQKLGMTEGSIKWYMQQVYDKIGTRRRLQAVERARQFGLIA